LDIDHRIHWRNFTYDEDELQMLFSKLNNVFFGCSPQVLYNKKMKMNIQKININLILPESVSPHIAVREVCVYVGSFILFKAERFIY
jgi:hypothetical protein